MPVICGRSFLRIDPCSRPYGQRNGGLYSRGTNLDRYPMGAGMEALGKELQKMNVARLYTLLIVS
jgi:hypothetical protein